MNTFGAWYDPTTWFSDSTTPEISGTAGSYTTPPSVDPFGWSSWLGGGQSTDVVGGISDSALADWNTYWASGGVMNANLGNTAGGGTTGSGTISGPVSSDNIFSGIGDFLSGLTSSLPGLVQTGLGTWQAVNQIISQQNPQDKLVNLPGSTMPVVERTQNGSVTYYPITQLYPSLAPQVQQAQQNSWLGPILLVGVLGIGAILIFKKN